MEGLTPCDEEVAAFRAVEDQLLKLVTDIVDEQTASSGTKAGSRVNVAEDGVAAEDQASGQVICIDNPVAVDVVDIVDREGSQFDLLNTGVEQNATVTTEDCRIVGALLSESLKKPFGFKFVTMSP
jgi:hypothetical protein